ncbi:MAG TPA: ABC transporter permease [Solirubrobacteraceae bacterium]|jgi:putative ABC transport system permease protein|nr:ABC transporter permease [Solirubrobacteraceae bacterium]
MGLINRGVRDAFRSVPRTVAIVLILGLSLGLSFVMLIGHRSVVNKIDATLATIGNTVNITPVGADTGTTSNKYLTTAELSKVEHLSDVAGLDETLGSGTRLDDERVGFVGTNDPTNPVNIGASTLAIIAGHAIDGTVNTKDAMVSTVIAKLNHLKVGATFTAYGTVFTVKAIFDSDTANGNNTIVVPLATEQHLNHLAGEVASAIATADSLTHLSRVIDEITIALGPLADVTSDLAQANQALAPLNSVRSLSLYSLTGAIGASAIISLLIMVMIVRERKREVGILKAIGAPNKRITYQFMTEALTFSVLGGAAGLIAGALGASSVTSSLVGNSGDAPTDPLAVQNPALKHLAHLHATASLPDILIGLAGILLIAAFGSAAASYLTTKIQPAEALRSE